MASPVKLERNGPILEITLDRPPANAIDLDVGRALHAAFRQLRDDADLRVGIITGGGQRSPREFFAAFELQIVDHVDEEQGRFALIRRAPMQTRVPRWHLPECSSGTGPPDLGPPPPREAHDGKICRASFFR